MADLVIVTIDSLGNCTNLHPPYNSTGFVFTMKIGVAPRRIVPAHTRIQAVRSSQLEVS